MYSGVEASFVEPEANTVLGPSLRKRIGLQNYEYKIRYESEHLFIRRKRDHNKLKITKI
jgi:hypothetical protein